MGEGDGPTKHERKKKDEMKKKRRNWKNKNVKKIWKGRKRRRINNKE